MKKLFIKKIKDNAVLIIALFAFVVFTGNKNPAEKKETAATNCCSGYDIPINKLKQFMVDSLHGIQFEGGVYAKADLIDAINKVSGDSVYLLNVLKNCNIAKGTDLVLTSPTTTGVVFTKQHCYPCPGKACCPPRVCATSINRSCVNNIPFSGFLNAEKGIISAEQ